MIVEEKAINGIKSILSNLDDKEVIALAATVTHGLLKNKVTDREDALEAIIKYSADPGSFLRRKLITRNHLFDYLHQFSVEVKLPITKEELTDKILTLWNNKTANTAQNEDNSSNSKNTNAVAIKVEIEEQKNEIEEQKYEIEERKNEIALQEINVMGVKFAEWFYKLLNEDSELGTEHFYPDASIHIQLVDSEVTVVESAAESSTEVCGLLFKTKQEHGLIFNPNLAQQGTMAKMDPHGLVIVASCGTLHNQERIIGVFEQNFALARDPLSENNWKIKNSRLTLRSKNVTQMPRILDI